MTTFEELLEWAKEKGLTEQDLIRHGTYEVAQYVADLSFGDLLDELLQGPIGPVEDIETVKETFANIADNDEAVANYKESLIKFTAQFKSSNLYRPL